MAAAVITSILEKLASLTGKVYKNHRNLQMEMAFLKDELGSMNAVLKSLSNMEEVDPQTTEWRNQVKDMAFDIEDCIDDFNCQVGENSCSHDAGFVDRIAQYVCKLRASYSFPTQIQQLKTRIKDVSERRKRYKLDESNSSSSSYVAVDPRVTALYVDAANIVGLDGPKEEVMKLLVGEESASVQSLRVVSIVGLGGLGKTTLANEVYRNVVVRYDCKAFVSVSQNPDLMKVLGIIMSSIGMPGPTCTYELQHLIGSLREHLRDRRYFFVIDDIWDGLAWEILRCAFPDNEKGSKIIITTRIETVARACCNYRNEFIYIMKSLDDQDSRKLFFSRVGNVSQKPPEEISNEILQKCGGLPLAIITIASLLASEPTTSIQQWEYVCRSLSSNLRTSPTLEGMRQVLNLSYKSLPDHLKNCLLYIGLYPEDYRFVKREMASLWLAEGLVSAIDGRVAEEVLLGYFNELINRSMIQPSIPDMIMFGDICAFKVHDMVLDLIRLKCEEENFARVVDKVQGMTTALHSKVRRLSLQFDHGENQDMSARPSFSHIRSLMLFNKAHFVLPISEFKSVRVLHLNCSNKIDLTSINKLFQLRYLKIVGSTQLPNHIRTLQRLEVLDLTETDSISLPSDIVQLPCLLHLRIPESTRLPDGIHKMTTLHTLQYFDTGMNSLENLTGVGDLINLRNLSVCNDSNGDLIHQKRMLDVLWPSIHKLINSNLRSLTATRIFPGRGSDIELSDSLASSQIGSCLEELCISCWMLSRVPSWTRQHHKLATLEFTIKTLTEEDIDLLAGLPNLIQLTLSIRRSSHKQITIRGTATTFPVLKQFILICYAPHLAFEAAAMPNLQSLNLNIHAHGVQRNGSSTVEGLEHLLSLKEFWAFVCFDGSDTNPLDGRAAATNAVKTLRHAINVHRGHPEIQIFEEDNRSSFWKIDELSNDA
uniref:NB-ARC domain-containing protein n=1 Tax=Leersia perrieri TaxID=77586 RepID=A0A0D9XQX9_9ORYZ